MIGMRMIGLTCLRSHIENFLRHMKMSQRAACASGCREEGRTALVGCSETAETGEDTRQMGDGIGDDMM